MSARPFVSPEQKIERLRGLIEEALEFIEEFEDVEDGSDGRQVANPAMVLASGLRAGLEET